jgi:hypothetical protein
VRGSSLSVLEFGLPNSEIVRVQIRGWAIKPAWFGTPKEDGLPASLAAARK